MELSLANERILHLQSLRIGREQHFADLSDKVSFLGNPFKQLNQSMGEHARKTLLAAVGSGEVSGRRDVRQETDPG